VGVRSAVERAVIVGSVQEVGNIASAVGSRCRNVYVRVGYASIIQSTYSIDVIVW